MQHRPKGQRTLARAFLLFGIAAAMTATPVAAQEDVAPPEGEVAPDAEAEETPDPAFEEARERFLRGVELADAGNCEGAIAEFNASMALVERPNTLFNIAQCQERLHRYDLAIAAYERYLATAPEDDPDRATVTATMHSLGNLLGTIHVASNVPAEVWLDDRVVGEAPGDVLVPGGRHVLELRATGRIPERREVEVSAGGEASVDVDLAAAEHHEHVTNTNVRVEAPPLPPALTISMIGASAVALGVGVGFGVNALMLSDREQARDPRLPRDASGIEESALFADIFFIAGGVLTAATFAMAFLTDWDSLTGSEREPSSEQVRVIPLIGPAFAGLRVEGIE